jgi:hypothetical protein
MESEVFVKTLCWFSSKLVKIDNLPSLVGTIVSVIYDNLSSFFVLSSVNIKAFLVLPIDEVFISIGKDLPPS